MKTKYRDMIESARRSPHYWSHNAWRQFQTQILHKLPDGDSTYKESAKALGLTTQMYLSLLRNDNPTLERMSAIAIEQGLRVRIVLEPIDPPLQHSSG